MNPRSSGTARKRPVNLTLDSRLVDSAKTVTGNLSGVVEQLLEDYVRKAREEQDSRKRLAARAADSWNRFDGECGSFADEFSTL